MMMSRLSTTARIGTAYEDADPTAVVDRLAVRLRCQPVSWMRFCSKFEMSG